MSLRIPPLVQVLICGAIGWGLSSVTPFLAFEGVWRSAAALLFIAAGMAILALALGAFIRARTTVNPLAPEEAATLVTTGLYRISRNPMYLAMAAILTGGAFLMAILRGVHSWRDHLEVLSHSARTSAMLFSVLIGALIFSNFVNRVGLPGALLELVTGYDLSPLMVLFMILLIYIVLGCIFESLSMLLLTIPIFYPVVQGLGYAGMSGEQMLVWFGIIAVVVTEISLITPPVGLNVFVLSAVLPDVSTVTVFKGVTPFWCVDIIRLLILVLAPGYVLLLPNLLYH